MSHATVRVHNPDLSVIELQFVAGSTVGSAVDQIREGSMLRGGYLKLEGVVVSAETALAGGKMYDFTDSIAAAGASDQSHQIVLLHRMVSKLSETILNPWNGDRDVRNVDPSFRSGLKAALGIQSKFVPCMVSSQMGGADQVIVANIIPSGAQISVLDELQMDRDDLTCARNVLFLALNIHKCFERLQLSFVPVAQSHAHTFNYRMVIHDPAIASMSIWDGHKSTIGMFADHYLNLAGHTPFRRALAYQAYVAHTHIMLGNSGSLGSGPTLTLQSLDRQGELEDMYQLNVASGKGKSA